MDDIKNSNKLLEEQLKRLELDDNHAPLDVNKWKQFLDSIRHVYDEKDQEQFLLNQSLAISSAQLSRLNKKLEHAQHIAMMGYWDYNKVSHRMIWSKELGRMLGFDLKQTTPKYEDVLKLIHDDDREMIINAVKEALHHNKEYDVEVRAKLPNGEWRWFRCIGHPELEAKEAIMHLTGVVLDITTRKKIDLELAAGRELADRNVQLEKELMRIQEADRLKDEFLANMSHELRTPLNTIIGFAEIIYYDKNHPVSTIQKEFLQDVLTSANHLLRLINDVLDLAKIETGKMDFEPQPLILSQIINEACELLKSIIREKNIQITISIDPSVDHVTNDPGKFKQVLFNLISNALKFTGKKGRIAISARAHDRNMFLLEIKDTGIGIHKKDLDKLFVPFQQLDTGRAKKYPGTGLGLAITRRIVEAQGGSVAVESTFGKGSTFYVLLPRILSDK